MTVTMNTNMKTFVKKLLIAPATFVIVTAAAFAPFESRAESTGWKKGKHLPDIVYVNDGAQTSLHEQRGKVVFVNFWASWCPYCAKEWRHVQAAYDEFGADRRVEFVLLNLFEPHSDALDFVAKHGYSAPVSDPRFSGAGGKKTRHKNALTVSNGDSVDYSPKWIPTSFVLNADGKIVKRFSGGTKKGAVRKAILKALQST